MMPNPYHGDLAHGEAHKTFVFENNEKIMISSFEFKIIVKGVRIVYEMED